MRLFRLFFVLAAMWALYAYRNEMQGFLIGLLLFFAMYTLFGLANPKAALFWKRSCKRTRLNLLIRGGAAILFVLFVLASSNNPIIVV